jgi:hypothetical protein
MRNTKLGRIRDMQSKMHGEGADLGQVLAEILEFIL